MGRFEQDGQAYQEGRNHWKVRNQVWCLYEKNHQEDGNHSARKIHMLFLRKGMHEEAVRRNLELQIMQEDRRWRRIRLQHNRCRYSKKCRQTSPRDEGNLNITS